MSIIDSERHADLIAAQLAVFDAWAKLEEYSAGLPRDVDQEQRARLEDLREAVRQAVMGKDDAVTASGLLEGHTRYEVDQALKQAGRAAKATAST